MGLLDKVARKNTPQRQGGLLQRAQDLRRSKAPSSRAKPAGESDDSKKKG